MMKPTYPDIIGRQILVGWSFITLTDTSLFVCFKLYMCEVIMDFRTHCFFTATAASFLCNFDKISINNVSSAAIQRNVMPDHTDHHLLQISGELALKQRMLHYSHADSGTPSYPTAALRCVDKHPRQVRGGRSHAPG